MGRFMFPGFIAVLTYLAVGVQSDSLIPFIEKAGQALGKEAFGGDVQLTQTIDEGKGLTIYSRKDGAKKTIPVFSRLGSDKGKAVVVLTAEEDRLPKNKEKRTFVVLRQSFDHPETYFVLYAYVRDVPKSEGEGSGVVAVADGKKLIEWDVWDHRGHYGNEAVTFGWQVCHSSPFTPCRDNDPAPQIDVQVELRVTETDEPDYPDATTAVAPAPVTSATGIPKFKAVTKEGFSVGANYDLFSDLDDDALQALFFGKTIRAAAIGEMILESAKPTLQALFHKLAPAMEAQVGKESTPPVGSPGADLAASVASAKSMSQVVSKVTQAFVKEVAVLGLMSDPLFASNRELTLEFGNAVGAQILTGLLNLRPSGNATLYHPNPALILDRDVLGALVGGGEGPLQTAVSLQGTEAVAAQKLFQTQAGLSAIFNEVAANDMANLLLPVLTGKPRPLPIAPKLEILKASSEIKPAAISQATAEPAGSMLGGLGALSDGAQGLLGGLGGGGQVLLGGLGTGAEGLLGGLSSGAQGLLDGLGGGAQGLLGGLRGTTKGLGSVLGGLKGSGGAAAGNLLGGLTGAGGSVLGALSGAPKKMAGFGRLFGRSVQESDLMDELNEVGDMNRNVRGIMSQTFIFLKRNRRSDPSEGLKAMVGNDRLFNVLGRSKRELTDKTNPANLPTEAENDRLERGTEGEMPSDGKQTGRGWFTNADDAPGMLGKVLGNLGGSLDYLLTLGNTGPTKLGPLGTILGGLGGGLDTALARGQEVAAKNVIEGAIAGGLTESIVGEQILGPTRRKRAADGVVTRRLKSKIAGEVGALGALLKKADDDDEEEEEEETTTTTTAKPTSVLGFLGTLLGRRRREVEPESAAPVLPAESGVGDDLAREERQDLSALLGSLSSLASSGGAGAAVGGATNGSSGSVSDLLGGLLGSTTGGATGGTGGGSGGAGDLLAGLLSSATGATSGVTSGATGGATGGAGGVTDLLGGLMGKVGSVGDLTSGITNGGGLLSGLASGLKGTVDGATGLLKNEGSLLGGLGGLLGRKKRESTLAAEAAEGLVADGETGGDIDRDERGLFDSLLGGLTPPAAAPTAGGGGLGDLLGGVMGKVGSVGDLTSGIANGGGLLSGLSSGLTGTLGNVGGVVGGLGGNALLSSLPGGEMLGSLDSKTLLSGIQGGLKGGLEGTTGLLGLGPQGGDGLLGGVLGDGGGGLLGGLLGGGRSMGGEEPAGPGLGESTLTKVSGNVPIVGGLLGNVLGTVGKVVDNSALGRAGSKIANSATQGAVSGAMDSMLGRKKRESTLAAEPVDCLVADCETGSDSDRDERGLFDSLLGGLATPAPAAGGGGLGDLLGGVMGKVGSVGDLTSGIANGGGLLSGLTSGLTGTLGNVGGVVGGLGGNALLSSLPGGEMLGSLDSKTLLSGIQGGLKGGLEGTTGLLGLGPQGGDGLLGGVLGDGGGGLLGGLLGSGRSMGGEEPAGPGLGESTLTKVSGNVPIVGGLLGNVLGTVGKVVDNSALGRAGSKIANSATQGAVSGAMDSMLGRKKRSVGSTKVSVKTNVDLFTVIGWTTQDETADLEAEKEVPTVSTSQKHVFIGFGPCKKVSLNSYAHLDSLDEAGAIDFYMQLLRTQCFPSKRNEIKELFDRKYLQLHADKYFQVPATLEVLKKSKLTVEETALLSRAFELATFSQVVIGQINQKTKLAETKSIQAVGISPSVATLMRFGLRFLDEVKSLAPQHLIKLSRGMTMTLKSALTKMTQDYNLVQFKSKYTDAQRQQVFEDVFQLAAMVHFYINGLNPIHNGEDTHLTFDGFVVQNEQEIYKRALLYCAHEA